MKVKKVIEGRMRIYCPGCEEHHDLTVNPGWSFNEDYEKPTFSPSLLVRSGHYVPGQEGKECWCTYKERFGEEADFGCSICHSFITDGQIQFLNDSTHKLAGQTVPLPDLPEKE